MLNGIPSGRGPLRWDGHFYYLNIMYLILIHLFNINYIIFNSMLLRNSSRLLRMTFGLYRNYSFPLLSTLDIFENNQKLSQASMIP
jgi:hypothetical protein